MTSLSRLCRAPGARRNMMLWALGIACQSCASTTLHSGKAPGETAAGYDARWHPAFLFGAVSYYERYDLGLTCPEGWSEVRVEPDVFTALASLVTAFIYTPSRLTIVCAAKDAARPPKLHDYSVPGLEAKTETVPEISKGRGKPDLYGAERGSGSVD